MKRLAYWVAGIATVTFAVMCVSGEAWAERRVALVVGNATYNAASMSLANPRNDAEDISAALKELDFKVVTAVNATRRDIELKLQEFARLAVDADSALFFYAGHAMQYQGRNFLVPTDAQLEDEFSVRFQMVSLDEVNAALERVNGVRILILDACRNNPLADSLQRRIAGASRSVATTRGLARIDKTQGMVVAYATAADEVAIDGQGRNSPFTAALLKRLQEPGLEIGIMFRRVASDVNSQTGGRQRPETTISLLSEYYLNQNDQIAWERIRDLDDVAALRDFVNKYPSSPRAIYARNRLDLLERNAREREEIARRVRDEERRRLAEEAEAKRREELKRQEEQKRVAALEEQKRQEEQKRKQEEQRRVAALEEQKRQEEQKRLAALEEQKRQEEQKRIAALDEQKRQEEQKRIAALDEQKRQEEQRRVAALEEQKRQEEQRRIAVLEDQKRQEEQKRVAVLEEQRRQEEQRRIAVLEDQKRQEEQKRVAALEEQKRQEEQKRIAALSVEAPATKVPPALAPPPGPTIQPQAAKANSLDQIRQAQTELKRLGCFDGEVDGKMNTTEKAIKELWRRSHKPIVEINITDDFIADLHRQPDDICPPPNRKPPPVASHPSPSSHKGATVASPAREPAPREARPQPPAQQPARATAEARQPQPSAAPRATGIGF